MPKVKYNSDVVVSVLLPTVNESKKYMDLAIQHIESVYNLDGSYGIGSIKQKLGDCKSNTVKYYNWLSSVNDKYVLSDDMVESGLSKISVPHISKRSTIVK